MTTQNQPVLNVTRGPVSAPSYPLLGEVIWWVVSGVMISREDLIDLFEVQGFPTDVIPKKIRVRSQVLRTLDSLAEDGFIRRIVEDPERSVFVLVGEEVDSDRETANYQIEETFIYQKKTEKLVANSYFIQRKIDELMEKFANSFLSSDIRLMIKGLSEKAAINASALRKEGGMYFVPDQNRNGVDRLARLLEAFGGGSYLGRLEIPTNSSNKSMVARSYMDEFKGEIEQAKKTIAALREAGNFRDSTLTKRMEELMQIQQNAKVYMTMLDLDRTAMDDAVKDVEDDILALMTRK